MMQRIARAAGGQGVVLCKVLPDMKLKSPLSKHMSDLDMEVLINTAQAKVGDLLLIAAGGTTTCQNVLGKLRLHCAQLQRERGLLSTPQDEEPDIFWVVDFPMFTDDEDEVRVSNDDDSSEGPRLASVHHPFTSPKDEDIDKLHTDPLVREFCRYNHMTIVY